MESKIGSQFGRLTAIEETGRNKRGRRQYICRCDCGNQIIVAQDQIVSGNTRSCGCLKKDKLIEIRSKNTGKRKYGNLTGKRYGKLLVIEKAIGGGNLHKWKCLCDCGNECLIDEYHLALGLTTSCGCASKDAGREELNAQIFESTRPPQLHNRPNKNNTSGIRGVSFKKDIGKWYAIIVCQGKRHFLGYFAEKEEAAKARASAEHELFDPIKERYNEARSNNPVEATV